MFVVRHDFSGTVRKRERALRVDGGDRTPDSAPDCPEISRRQRRDDAPTAVQSTWRSVFVRRVRRVS